jgi:hypothetical protein
MSNEFPELFRFRLEVYGHVREFVSYLTSDDFDDINVFINRHREQYHLPIDIACAWVVARRLVS